MTFCSDTAEEPPPSLRETAFFAVLTLDNVLPFSKTLPRRYWCQRPKPSPWNCRNPAVRHCVPVSAKPIFSTRSLIPDDVKLGKVGVRSAKVGHVSYLGRLALCSGSVPFPRAGRKPTPPRPDTHATAEMHAGCNFYVVPRGRSTGLTSMSQGRRTCLALQCTEQVFHGQDI